MAKSAKQVQVSALTPVAVAVATLFPVFASLQDRTKENADESVSRSKKIVSALIVLRETTTDATADGVALLGDGKRGTTAEQGTKGELADKLNAKYGKALHVTVRNELAWARIVWENWTMPGVFDAAVKSGLRKARDVAKPRAKVETETVAATPTPAYSQALMVELVAAHFDDAVFALRAYLLRAADSIGVAKLGEIEVHLANKTRKSA